MWGGLHGAMQKTAAAPVDKDPFTSDRPPRASRGQAFACAAVITFCKVHAWVAFNSLVAEANGGLYKCFKRFKQ